MKIKYLGTGAAEGIPAIFCNCSICKNAKQVKGKEIRTRCQAIVDDEVIIDFGPDTYWHLIQYGIDISQIELCLITHSHPDHLFVNDILMRKGNHALYDFDIPSLKVIGGKGVQDCFSLKGNNYITKDGRVIFRLISAFEKIIHKDYVIVALPAIHKTEEPFVYLISKDNKTILYAHDTDIFDESVWSYLVSEKIHLDLVSLDCTEGIKYIDYAGHMNFERDFMVRMRMLNEEIASSDTLFVASHFSHNGLISHKNALEKNVSKGFLIAYDGMEIQI